MTTIIGNVAFGTQGDDNIFSPGLGPVNDSNGSHTVLGLNGSDEVFGNGGNDTVFGGNGDDDVTGDAGNDTVSGDAGNDYLNGGSGTNTLFGGSGNDQFWSDGGNDHYFGGSGFDTLVYSDLGIGANVDVAAGTGATGDTISGIEQFIGTNTTDLMRGDNAANWFSGNAGADLLFGGGGNDSLDGGEGNDLLEGGSGADGLYGGNGTNTATYEHSAAGVSVDLTAHTGFGGEATGDVVYGVSNVIGSSHDDYLFGDWSNNTLFGGAGNDWIKGATGADNLYGGSGFDAVSYSHSFAGVSIDLASNLVHNGDAQGDVISGFEAANGSDFADDLYGNSAGNSLWGGAGGDYIDGRGGNDFIVGGNGQDFLNGGTGDDTFMYYYAAESGPGAASRDLIKDFVHGDDHLDVSYLDANAGTNANEAFSFIGQNGFSAAGQARYYFDGGNTVVELNTSGAGGAEMELLLQGHIQVHASDFDL